MMNQPDEGPGGYSNDPRKNLNPLNNEACTAAHHSGLMLSIRNPYAVAVVLGIKNIENRMWTPPVELINRRFWVHVGGTYLDDASGPRFLPGPHAHAAGAGIHGLAGTSLRGVVAGSVRLVSVIAGTDCFEPWCQRRPGSYAWRLDNLLNRFCVSLAGPRKGEKRDGNARTCSISTA